MPSDHRQRSGVLEGWHVIVFHRYPIASDSSTTTRSDVRVGNS